MQQQHSEIMYILIRCNTKQSIDKTFSCNKSILVAVAKHTCNVNIKFMYYLSADCSSAHLRASSSCESIMNGMAKSSEDTFCTHVCLHFTKKETHFELFIICKYLNTTWLTTQLNELKAGSVIQFTFDLYHHHHSPSRFKTLPT